MVLRILTLTLCLYIAGFQSPSEGVVSESLGPLSLYHEASNVRIDKEKFDLKKYKPEKLDLYHPYWHWRLD